MNDRRCITLITDFGMEGPYTGALKGAILNVNPNATVVDITHQISPGNILEAAFVLKTSHLYFPAGTIHVVVVDPGVGSGRRALLISTENHYFIGPDNGVFTCILGQEDVYNVFELTEEHFFLNPVSHTFHGRDVFAPVAGWLSKNVDTAKLGTPTASYTTVKWPEPAEIRPKAIKGCILLVDRFGNLITNLTPRQVPLEENGHAAIIKVVTTGGEITATRRYYTESADKGLFLILGGTGYYEIAACGEPAAAALGLKAGSEIGVLVR